MPMSSIHQCIDVKLTMDKHNRIHHLQSSSRRLFSSTQSSRSKFRFSELSSRQSAELEDELLNRLNNNNNNISNSDQRLMNPIIGKSLTRNGLDWIWSVSIPSSFDKGEENVITVNLQPPTMLHPKLQEITSNITQVVQEEMVQLLSNKHTLEPHDVDVSVKINPQDITTASNNMNIRETTPQSSSFALKNITHFVAVYSCKGGVGKSTIAANLAYQLSAMGGRVGLLDLDVYGPSLPILVQPDDPTVRKSPPHVQEGMVEPILHKGVKLMSLGFVSPNSGVPGSGPNGGAALLKGTNWGELDVLVLDLPPGTGDVQLEVCQSLSLTGAVAVSTPSALAWADVRKGTLALVENFAYFVCEGGGRHYPFGKARTLAAGDDGDDGSNETTSDAPMQHHHFMPQSSHVFHLPISETVSDSNESGKPFCCDEPNGNSEVFSKLADAVSADLLLLQHNMMPASMQGQQGNSGYQKIIGGDDLRSRNPKTGEVEENSSSNSGEGDGKTVQHGCGGGSHSSDRGSSQPSITVHHHSSGCADNSDKKDNLFPAKLSKKGKYGYEVEWADGATIIYSLLAIAKAAGGKPLESTPE
ncbi:NUBPL iron-transfer P-loop NTPase family protein [Skeletonema marinoi]|uniref:NUBPL iron-transfer P-loop NTPase family protein n=1 Tax=Skeletonema marinoi TaxID=267567 RepID=A0AAD8YGZ1_9STRA|nr:NUBPL iron-transfer P-loop NTPase family protein [Skeletonema marinoi]